MAARFRCVDEGAAAALREVEVAASRVAEASRRILSFGEELRASAAPSRNRTRPARTRTRGRFAT
jgi:hypothetical protein